MRNLESKSFLLLTVLVTLAFAWVLWPFFGAILWATVVAILFAPLNRRLLGAMPGRPNMAATATIVIVLLMVIVPLVLISVALVNEAAAMFEQIKSGEIDVGGYFQAVFNALPSWTKDFLAEYGFGELGAVQDRLSGALTVASQYVAAQVVGISQSTVAFFISLALMLYLAFFLIRDGDRLFLRVRKAVPLNPAYKRALFAKFTTVVRATVKGVVLIAALQGLLGGLIFWFLGVHAPLLWGVLMMALSLLPAIGAAAVWVPVAIYLFATGAIWKAVVLILFGALVIGLVDNLLRPRLVGKDLRLPDYVVLISTLGGLAVFGLDGFVVGPAIAALFIAVWNIFPEAQSDDEAEPAGETDRPA
ncbi:AI-2E family transporter [Pleomorphomonas diazotrophica]|uniref:AI-2E family transporter n=1 Tax=Pleomorphomonas diazotrophica TaxID=1166257 RepID=A0A1I4UN66_9HYPH|nr:AI-2E family transporter [Pleomorphomonas diazotrophica]PKR88344.1 AI-2E family transporter [Pleomorphomonas diazotrophica]SFM90429.1 Predicted PurR-regulated permease PerM [Pleomorphomonas diazotrophica]